MKMETTCPKCHYGLILGAQHCAWCGAKQKKSVAAPKGKGCPDCGGLLFKGASFCAWCGENLNGDKKTLTSLNGLACDAECPLCGGMILGTMEYCPSCGVDYQEILPSDEQCPHCHSYFHPAQYYCACCGGYLTPFIIMPLIKSRLEIAADALFLLCLAAAERFEQGRGSKSKKKGFESVGLIMGHKKNGLSQVEAVHPFIAAVVSADQAKGRRYFDAPHELALLCRSRLKCLGTFHSHVNGDPRPSERDLPGITAGHLEMIVGVRPEQGKQAWTFSSTTFGLEGTVGGLFFSVGAYTRDKGGVLRSIMVSLAPSV
jgi:proteasome lid subunit RPN8/RPN11